MTGQGAATAPDVDILIVGAGFAGLAMAIRLKQAGFTSFLLIERASDLGGTWRDNHYPGCACDIPSHLYSLSFEPKDDWSRIYPDHRELLAYLQGITDKHGLRPQIRFDTTMREATYDESAALWHVGLADNQTIVARVLISAMGALTEPSMPHFEGIETFKGKIFHSARWDHDYDLTGKRIAVIGTGASAVQFIPKIAPKAGKLFVFQRSAPWIMPKRDRPISPRVKWMMQHVPLYRRLFRWWLFWQHEIRVIGFTGAFNILKTGEKLANGYRERKIKDIALREKLTPDYLLGCKRVLIANDYYQTFAKGQAELVTDAIARIGKDHVVTKDGAVRPVDAIIYGTGFTASDMSRYGRIQGIGGADFAGVFARGLNIFWGIGLPSFPNYFMLLGPNTGLGHNSVVLMIEAQIRYILSALEQMRQRDLQAIELRPEPAAAFSHDLDRRMASTVWQKGGCESWYRNAQGRNTTLWPGSVVEYVWRTRRASLDDFKVTPSTHG